MSASFHKSNLGSFGDNLPCDMDGYVHTTISAWMKARVDFGGVKMTSTDKRDWAREKAQETREAVKLAESGLKQWQESN